MLVISGDWSTPSQLFQRALIVRLLRINERDDPLELMPNILRDPLPQKVTHVAVAPLR